MHKFFEATRCNPIQKIGVTLIYVCFKYLFSFIWLTNSNLLSIYISYHKIVLTNRSSPLIECQTFFQLRFI
jgi:hypothetical protein